MKPSRWLPLTVFSSALLYYIVGVHVALDATTLKAPKTVDGCIAQLEAELRRNPNHAEAWRLLGRALQRENQPAKARDAYAKATGLAPGDADIATEAAQVRALADDRRLFDTQAVALLQGALKAQPNHQRARWLLGITQRLAGDNAAAVATWRPLLTQVDAPTAASLRKEIDNARLAASMQPLPEPWRR